MTIFSQLNGYDLQKGWVNDATCVQNSRHVDLFGVFDSEGLDNINNICTYYK
jgi:hypothetical protein